MCLNVRVKDHYEVRVKHETEDYRKEENEEREEEERKAKCLLAQNKINMLTKILKLMQKFNDKNSNWKG